MPGTPKKKREPSALARALAADLIAEDTDAAKRERYLAAAIAWLEEKWGAQGKPCPYCGVAEWKIGEPVYILSAYVVPRSTRALSPAFTVMCGNCGQTLFVNALLGKIVEEEE